MEQHPPQSLRVGLEKMDSVLEERRVYLWVHRQSLTLLLLSATLGAPLASVSISRFLYSAIVPRQHTVFSGSDIAIGFKKIRYCKFQWGLLVNDYHVERDCSIVYHEESR